MFQWVLEQIINMIGDILIITDLTTQQPRETLDNLALYGNLGWNILKKHKPIIVWKK